MKTTLISLTCSEAADFDMAVTGTADQKNRTNALPGTVSASLCRRQDKNICQKEEAGKRAVLNNANPSPVGHPGEVEHAETVGGVLRVLQFQNRGLTLIIAMLR